MRDFPFFPTEYGISSISLREIPYKGQAFIFVRSVQEGMLWEHLRECVSLCRMAGAERILAGNHKELEVFPLYMRLLEMEGIGAVSQPEGLLVREVTADTAGQWRKLYNEKMRRVDGASTMEHREEGNLPGSGACFVERERQLLGIGWLEGDTIRAVASLIPDAGEQIVQALTSRNPGGRMRLEVASTNEKALRLYERLGFQIKGCLAEWREIPDTFR